MATVFDKQNPVSEENWDEDYEFHASPKNDKRVPLPSHPTRASTTSSHFTEDWDKEVETHDSRPSQTSAIHQQDKENLHLSNWAEPGPSTPSKRLFSNSTENWDDDFEDRGDSPKSSAKRTTPSKHRHTDSLPRSRLQFEPESWDEEFDLASPISPSKSTAAPINDHFDDTLHDDEEDDMDFNFHDKDEDRTVTARSRRAALTRLHTTPTSGTTSSSSSSNASPPPPVPPIPFSLLNTASSSTGYHFPRSPTSSVFSAPSVNSGRESVAYSYYHNNSTTHLRPTISRSSISGFANLPPSPPIHKERERRRLRKKSRPDPAGIELAIRGPIPSRSVNASAESVGLRYDRDVRPTTPQTPPRSSSPQLSSAEPVSSPPTAGIAIKSNNRQSVISSASSPPNKTPLLSRIGSVKKWGVRKKRASSTPSEVMVQEGDAHADTSDTNIQEPSSRSGWFFRAASGGSNGNSSTSEMGRKVSVGPSSSTYDLSEDDSELTKSAAYTPKARKVAPPSSEAESSAKLVKRKSLGFVQIRRSNGPLNDNSQSIMHEAGELPSDLEQELGLYSDLALGRSPSKRKKKAPSQAAWPAQSGRHVSYGGIGLGRAGKSFESSSDDLTEKDNGRSRTRSFSRSKSREPADEGSRSFMGSVRRISLVGRHRRSKSGVSLVGVEETGKSPPELPSQRSETDDSMDVDPHLPPLLPPIELQPPSPPQTIGRTTARTPSPVNLDTLLPSHSPPSTSSPSLAISNKAPASPQSASLGRSAVSPVIASNSAINNANVPRRNSLGDLKIPARISQAQVGLRRDLGMVREFAANVEQLKELQVAYSNLVMEVQSVLDAYASQASSRATSPSFFGRPLSRVRPNSATPNGSNGQPQQAYKQLAAAFYTINSKYRIAWECAELLIELGTGSTSPSSPPTTSVSVPTMATTFTNEGKKSRERAVTLSGEESKPPTPIPGQTPSTQSATGPPIASPPNLGWRASTGRHDLSQRQLLLLREMLNNPDTSVIDPQQIPSLFDDSTLVNRDWRWGEAMNSTVTLPSEESSAQDGSNGPCETPAKKRRASRLVGMSGIRDMLRSLKRSQNDVPPVPTSSTSLSTESSVDSGNGHRASHGKVPTYGRRRAKTSSGPESVRSNSPYQISASFSAKQSPRRPSLASIFRIGQKSKPTTPSSTQNPSSVDLSTESLHRDLRESSSSTGGDEDWDRIESPSDTDHHINRAREAATIRGRSPYMQDSQLPSGLPSRPQTPKTQRSTSASHSQSSLQWEGLPPASVGVPTRVNRLSNVEENAEDLRGNAQGSSKTPRGKPTPSPSRPPSRSKNIAKTGSVRSMPPQPLLPDAKLAMTPENIKPLLENSKEVHARLLECIAEIRQLLVE
ncbi:hypothetical protein Moror_9711 [Moniliophthora roreri MCA 2997]|uniref:Uncharacterized protein n=1 Tax=Moniliophthora roreri (strain MCA 2997) TaxID=1381753 RepID=V2X2J3_MONRO|nr:hypothetical protein Moror_9711 [Moniliophthora roreri MCA 2997]